MQSPLLLLFNDLTRLRQVEMELRNFSLEQRYATQVQEEMAARADDDWIVVSVNDTGCGIPESIRHRIFDPFFTTKEVGRGPGQGLAILRNIVVERHHGRFDVETAEGTGTTMHIRLPLLPDPTPVH